MFLRAHSLVGELDLLPNDVVHAIRVLLRKQVDFRWVVSKAHGTNDAQIGFWEIGRLSYDQQDGQKVHANSKRCGRVAWYHWTILCLSGEAGTTQLKWTWVVPLGVGPGHSLNVSDASCWWLVAGHRHLGSSESLQGLGEQTYSTWPGSVLSLYVNFLRRNQMTVFLLLLLLFLPISKDSEVEQFYTKEFHEVDS